MCRRPNPPAAASQLNKRILAHIFTVDVPAVYIRRKINAHASTTNSPHLGRVPLKIPAGKDRGRPARDGLARRLAPDDRLTFVPLGELGLGPGHGGGGGRCLLFGEQQRGWWLALFRFLLL